MQVVAAGARCRGWQAQEEEQKGLGARERGEVVEVEVEEVEEERMKSRKPLDRNRKAQLLQQPALKYWGTRLCFHPLPRPEQGGLGLDACRLSREWFSRRRSLERALKQGALWWGECRPGSRRGPEATGEEREGEAEGVGHWSARQRMLMEAQRRQEAGLERRHLLR